MATCAGPAGQARDGVNPRCPFHDDGEHLPHGEVGGPHQPCGHRRLKGVPGTQIGVDVDLGPSVWSVSRTLLPVVSRNPGNPHPGLRAWVAMNTVMASVLHSGCGQFRAGPGAVVGLACYRMRTPKVLSPQGLSSTIGALVSAHLATARRCRFRETASPLTVR